MASLNDKTLIMVVGPSSVGKSTLMNEVVRLDPSFGRVRSFTTRPARTNDEPGQYLYLTDEELTQRSDSGELITDVVYPTTGFHYGTVAESFANTYNLLDTLANSVEEYRALPFARTVTISLTAEPEAWSAWLKQRFPDGGDDMRRRLEEAVLSITWSLEQSDDHYWLVNRPGALTDTAHDLIRLAKAGPSSTNPPPEASQLLETARNLLSYEVEMREPRG
jgi:guanylate kinase